MAQTAVEWFVQQLEEYGSDDFKIIYKKQFEQAKAKEKEQIIDFAKQWEERQNDGNLDTIEMLYKETYNK